MERIQFVLDDTALKELKAALESAPREFYGTVNRVILPQAQKLIDATEDTLNEEW